jgi:hypothetical protein
MGLICHLNPKTKCHLVIMLTVSVLCIWIYDMIFTDYGFTGRWKPDVIRDAMLIPPGILSTRISLRLQ